MSNNYNPYNLTKNEYEYLTSKTHISMPHIFGPGRWDLMHSYAKMCITPNEKEKFADFIYEIFMPTIKCSECQMHFKNLLNEIPVPFGKAKFNNMEWNEKDSCFKWSWRVHNIVNKRLGKPEISFETCCKLYDKNSETCSQCYKQ